VGWRGDLRSDALCRNRGRNQLSPRRSQERQRQNLGVARDNSENVQRLRIMARMRELGVMSTDFTLCNMSIRKMRVDDYVVTEREPAPVRGLPHRVKVEKRHPEERQQNHQACLTRPNPSHEVTHYARRFIAASSQALAKFRCLNPPMARCSRP